MANHMETYVNIKNGDINIAQKLKEIFTPPDGRFECDTIELVKRTYDDIPSEEIINSTWCNDKLGAKWMYSEFEYNDDCEYIELKLTSAWSVPCLYLEQLAKILYTIKEDCYITGIYQDEGYDPIGAYLYAKNYNDIEDLDIIIESDKLWNDDEYLESIYEQNYNLQKNLEMGYKEYLKDF